MRKHIGAAVTAVLFVAAVPVRAQEATTTSQVERTTTTVSEIVRPRTAEELAQDDPHEQVTTEEAPPYVGPPLPQVDLSASTFDPRAQGAFAAFAAVRAELDAARQTAAGVAAETQRLVDQVAGIKALIKAAEKQRRDRSVAMRNLAVRSYMSDLGVQLPSDEDGRGAYYGKFARGLMRDAFKRDTRTIEKHQRELVEAERLAVIATTTVTTHNPQIANLEQRVRALEATLRLFAVGSTGVPVGFRFPIAAPYAFGDSWGAPRMVGTSYAHAHEGTDVFATFGSPLVAVEDGIVYRVGRDTLGGMKLWLIGAHSGNRYYYAHLSAFADGLVEGQRVAAGQMLGRVGDSGNAKGTAAHLHFEIHPNGARAVNPYPLLKVASAGDPDNKRR